MTVPIVGRDDSFPALCKRIRRALLAKHGAHNAKPFLLLLDLIEVLDMDKMDRVKPLIGKPEA